MLVEEIGLKEEQGRVPGFWTQAFKLVSYFKNKAGGGTTFGLFWELFLVNLHYRKVELVLCYIPRKMKYYLQYQHNSCQPAFANELDTSRFSLLTCQTTESSRRDVKYSMPWCSMIQFVGNGNAAWHCAQISSTVRPQRSTLLTKGSSNRSEQNEVEWKRGDNTCVTEDACVMQSFNEDEVHFRWQINLQM